MGTCSRCGRFHCAAEQIALDDRVYCADCGTRQDVDWLGQHYRKLEGQRSGVVWFLLLLGIGLSAASIAGLAGAENWKERGFLAGLLAFGLASLTPMSGKPWSRWVLLLSGPLAAIIFVSATGDGWGFMLVVPMVGVAAMVWTDVRTRLFFRLPVPRKDLHAHFRREGSNPLAVYASRLALLGLFVPGVCVISLVMGVVALTRIDSKAIPPVGNLSAALGAIIFSTFTSLMWGVSFLGMRH